MDKLALSRKEASELTGICLPYIDAYIARKENPLPHFHNGRSIVIPTAAFREWLDAEAKRSMAS